MTPLEWAEVFAAGYMAIPSKGEPAANALGLALYAMQQKAQEISVRHDADPQEQP
jgi:hypothetical protein